MNGRPGQQKNGKKRSVLDNLNCPESLALCLDSLARETNGTVFFDLISVSHVERVFPTGQTI
jgi:hypothetical protein